MGNVIPTNYELKFEPLFSNFTFNGIEIITVNLQKSTDLIILDAAELKIKNCHVIQTNYPSSHFIRSKTCKKNQGKSKTLHRVYWNIKRQTFGILQKSVQGQEGEDKVHGNNTV